jgi:hypothetical protein
MSASTVTELGGANPTSKVASSPLKTPDVGTIGGTAGTIPSDNDTEGPETESTAGAEDCAGVSQEIGRC